MMFAVKTSVLTRLLENPKWTRRLEKCETMKQVEDLLMRFCRENGFKINLVPLVDAGTK